MSSAVRLAAHKVNRLRKPVHKGGDGVQAIRGGKTHDKVYPNMRPGVDQNWQKMEEPRVWLHGGLGPGAGGAGANEASSIPCHVGPPQGAAVESEGPRLVRMAMDFLQNLLVATSWDVEVFRRSLGMGRPLGQGRSDVVLQWPMKGR